MYGVKIIDENGAVYYLSHKGRTSWSKRTAQKHRKDWLRNNPKTTAEIEEG